LEKYKHAEIIRWLMGKGRRKRKKLCAKQMMRSRESNTAVYNLSRKKGKEKKRKEKKRKKQNKEKDARERKCVVVDRQRHVGRLSQIVIQRSSNIGEGAKKKEEDRDIEKEIKTNTSRKIQRERRKKTRERKTRLGRALQKERRREKRGREVKKRLGKEIQKYRRRRKTGRERDKDCKGEKR